MSFKIMDATSVSSTNTVYSNTMTFSTDTYAAIQVTWTGTPTGTLYLQVSNDGTNWVTTSEVFPANPAGSATSTAETWSGFGYKYARVKYTNASGTGTMTMYAMLKK